MGKNNKSNLKKQKEEIEELFNNKEYDKAVNKCGILINEYPKNYYGYYGIIKSKTNDFTKYLNEDEVKELKKHFEMMIKLDKGEKLKDFKELFNEYQDDCTAVFSLKKIKKELISKCFLKRLYNEEITYVNQNINIISSYNLSGQKIVNVYDFIRGMFLLACLIFNLVFRNYLLILTIPFGIFGLITVYSFFSTNFIGNNVLKSEKDKVKKMINMATLKVANLKNKVQKTDETIKFLKEQKASSLLKIPAVFSDSIKEYSLNDEDDISESIINELLSNNFSSFTYLINEKTNLDVDDVLLQIKPDVISKEDELTCFINDKVNQKKSNNSEVIWMKPVKTYNYIIICLLSIISMISLFVLIKTFKDINSFTFIIALIIGVLSALVYNIKTGKHLMLKDTFIDNLLLCVFDATLTYDLLYLAFNSKLKFIYGFIKMPIIFTLILMGVVSIISVLKYNNLIKKLRGE